MTAADPSPAPAAAQHPLVAERRRAVRVALALALLGALVTALVWVDPSHGPLQGIDRAVWHAARRVEVGGVTAVAKAITWFGQVTVQVVLWLVFLAWLASRRRVRDAVFAALAFGTGGALAEALKVLVDRARPLHSLVRETEPSFPSGHVMAATLAAGVLVLVLVAPGPRRRVWTALAIAYVVLMAADRCYLRAHWLSDTVASALLGTVVVLGWAMVVERYGARLARPRRRVAATVR